MDNSKNDHLRKLRSILVFLSGMSNQPQTLLSSTSPSDDNDGSGVENVSSLTSGRSFVSTFNSMDDMAQSSNRIDCVVFDLYQFQMIDELCNSEEGNQVTTLPFSLYAASAGVESQTSKRQKVSKSLWQQSEMYNSVGDRDDASSHSSPCWLRLSRITVTGSPPGRSKVIQQFLDKWSLAYNIPTQKLVDTFPLPQLPQFSEDTPKPLIDEVRSYVRKLRKFQRRERLRSIVEPMYDKLFELCQLKNDVDCFWGFGNARLARSNSDGTCTLVQGPLIEVRVEIELANDGALLIRPCEHSGVAVKWDVLSELSTLQGSMSNEIRTLVEELEPTEIAPGQPTTYQDLLKKLSVKLTSRGVFCPFLEISPVSPDNLVISDSWCFYWREKPNTSWSRDALIFSEKVLTSSNVPKATIALTCGPGAIQEITGTTSRKRAAISILDTIRGILGSKPESWSDQKSDSPSIGKTLFPLPYSPAQLKIAELLESGEPSVICEGPPGCGKTHTIANIVCLYLAQGKRVLVTSKGAPALTVLRDRLPESLQDLVVDVSSSESSGMRQLQKTVERLADRIAVANLNRQSCEFLQAEIERTEKEISSLDSILSTNFDAHSKIISSDEGSRLLSILNDLIKSAPWLLRTLSSWSLKMIQDLIDSTTAVSENAFYATSAYAVTGFTCPPTQALMRGLREQAGINIVSKVTGILLGHLPVIGTHINKEKSSINDELSMILINGRKPQNVYEWKIVYDFAKRVAAIHEYYDSVLVPLVSKFSWPNQLVLNLGTVGVKVEPTLLSQLKQMYEARKLFLRVNLVSSFSQDVDQRRRYAATKLQNLQKKYVETRVVDEMAKIFSPEAQSALIRFSQLAGKAKFSSGSARTGKFTQRQHRHRSQYLDAFDKCVRYIPCWILTCQQCSQYLPTEFGMFDLVVIDEASQSDISALPAMLRGKQWLIVGDSKQVSPTEAFVSEQTLAALQVSLPDSPFREYLLPGNSFFDLCAQMFPISRVILYEHFRCSPEIIHYSNEQFYHGRLNPVRLPTSKERLQPSLLDLYVRNGRKKGKINEEEKNAIVSMILDTIKECDKTYPRSIGVISLLGDEQARLIRAALLEAIGPEMYKKHDVLIGDPPRFQGAERDIIFLSMVCSPGQTPTQCQQMHAQRANVALSRARDRMILVRSITANHIVNIDDVKNSILLFFSENANQNDFSVIGGRQEDKHCSILNSMDTCLHSEVCQYVAKCLKARGYSVQDMNRVWKGAICIEDETNRFAFMIEAYGECRQEWEAMQSQQRVLERVGWICFRFNALSVLGDLEGSLRHIEQLAESLSIKKSAVGKCSMSENNHSPDVASSSNIDDCGDSHCTNEEIRLEPISDSHPVIVVSSSDDESDGGIDKNATINRSNALIEQPPNSHVKVKMEHFDYEVISDKIPAERYGSVVDFQFTRNRRFAGGGDINDNEQGSSFPSNDRATSKKKRSFRRLDSYKRDGRWLPDPKNVALHEDDEDEVLTWAKEGPQMIINLQYE